MHPYPVNAAAAESDFLYLLSSSTVLKMDLGGTVLTTYRFQLDRNFRAATLGVTGDDLYLVDRVGRTERFQLP